MAILPPNAWHDTWGVNPYANPKIDITESYDHAISGRMFLAVVHSLYDPRVNDKDQEDRVKYELTEKLIRGIIESKCVEFTKSLDNTTGAYTYRARCFVTPDAQVKILRTHLPPGKK
jgi:hypothetical protein